MSSASTEGAPAFSSKRAWIAVVVLMLVGVINQVDRLLPGIVVEPIKHDLALSDTAIGLINGFGFVVVYATLGLPIARISDRGLYGAVITVCLSLWSVMTLLGAATQAGWQFALTRMGVALGEAGNTPAAHAFISRNFAPTRRGAPLAVLTLSIPFASTSALIAGGLLTEAVGWRMTFVIMGVIGLALAPIVLIALGPKQTPVERQAPPSLSLAPVLLLLRKPSFLLTVTATSFIGIGGYTLATFSAAFLMRVHGMSLGAVAVQYGVAVGISGVISVLFTGLVSDRLSARDPRWILWTLSLFIAALLPFGYSAYLVDNNLLTLVCMALTNVIATAYMAPAVAAIQRLAPAELRATASSVFLMFGALAGGLGPMLTGMISDALHPAMGAESLRYGMLLVPVAFTLSALLYGAATLTFRRDMENDPPPARP